MEDGALTWQTRDKPNLELTSCQLKTKKAKSPSRSQTPYTQDFTQEGCEQKYDNTTKSTYFNIFIYFSVRRNANSKRQRINKS